MHRVYVYTFTTFCYVDDDDSWWKMILWVDFCSRSIKGIYFNWKDDVLWSLWFSHFFLFFTSQVCLFLFSLFDQDDPQEVYILHKALSFDIQYIKWKALMRGFKSPIVNSDLWPKLWPKKSKSKNGYNFVKLNRTYMRGTNLERKFMYTCIFV